MTEFVRLDGPTIDKMVLAAVDAGSDDFTGAPRGEASCARAWILFLTSRCCRTS